MTSKVIEQAYSIYIPNIPRLEWGKKTQNSFIRCAQLVLNSLGENFSYDFLMGISGAAFRFHFHPDWCPSAADCTTGFDVSKILFKSVGYKSELVRIDDSEFEDIRSLYKKITEHINFGNPIIAINLKKNPDWGIITGYLKYKPGILCRTYYDESDEYSLAEHAPWLSFFIEKKYGVISKEELFKNSLEIAVQLAYTKSFGEYISGFHAMEFWIDQLKKTLENSHIDQFEQEVNIILYKYLLDSRRAAVEYLKSMSGLMKNGDSIINAYKNVFELLKTIDAILPDFESESGGLRIEILKQQKETLFQALLLERSAVKMIQEELAI